MNKLESRFVFSWSQNFAIASASCFADFPATSSISSDPVKFLCFSSSVGSNTRCETFCGYCVLDGVLVKYTGYTGGRVGARD